MTCKHPTCGAECRRPAKVKERKLITPKKIYRLKQTPLKKRRHTKAKPRKGATLSELTLRAQAVFNEWIRRRDEFEACISSGQRPGQAGHFYPAGSFSGVRFDEVNVNGQSVEDNINKSGNEQAYRIGLVARYGTEAVAALDARARETKLKKWTREELIAIIVKYKS
ncbi:recombination protein NinG [Terrimonas ginsenosidimutans]|uniref:recombination protein NinG n=1 Tax=Terrimonas ginsenosidimutans TaxID=2908004 RepID=UPI003D7BEA2D